MPAIGHWHDQRTSAMMEFAEMKPAQGDRKNLENEERTEVLDTPKLEETSRRPSGRSPGEGFGHGARKRSQNALMTKFCFSKTHGMDGEILWVAYTRVQKHPVPAPARYLWAVCSAEAADPVQSDHWASGASTSSLPQ